MVNCPECGESLKKGSSGESKYYCENNSCGVIFVRYPFESYRTKISYSGLAKRRTIGLLPRESPQQSIEQ
jgi:hypothetical protein